MNRLLIILATALFSHQVFAFGVFCQNLDDGVQTIVEYPQASEDYKTITLYVDGQLILDSWFGNEAYDDVETTAENWVSVSDECRDNVSYWKSKVTFTVRLKGKIILNKKVFLCTSRLYTGCNDNG